MTSPEKTLAWSQRWAQSGWLDSLKKTSQCLVDTDGLRRCGIETDFKAHEINGEKPESAAVRYQDALSQRLAHFVDLEIETRAGSLAERTFYYPYKLAALTSENPEVVAAALREFHADALAWWEAKELPSHQS